MIEQHTILLGPVITDVVAGKRVGVHFSAWTFATNKEMKFTYATARLAQHARMVMARHPKAHLIATQKLWNALKAAKREMLAVMHASAIE